MARERKYEEVTVTKRKAVDTFNCDGCGRELIEGDYNGDEVNDLRVYLNPHECVSFGHGRDYCTECVKPIWDAICKLIGADPDSESKESLEGGPY